MRLNDFKLIPKNNIKSYIATDIKPSYKYEGGKRTELQDGFKVEVVLPEMRFDKIFVKLEQVPDNFFDQDFPFNVKFVDLEFYAYTQNSNIAFGARAATVHLVSTEENKTVK